MDIRFTALEHELWENFMANETDKKLLALYQEILSRGNSNVTGLKKRYLFLYSDKEDEVCAQLKKLTTSSL